MNTSQTLPELIAAAQVTAKTSEETILEIRDLLEEQTASEAQMEECRVATVALEAAAVDTFTLFEARLQHHFRRGPFSRKLRAALLDAGHSDLADKIHKYYLAINVLKHGKGASYRELCNTPTKIFHVKRAETITSPDEHAPSNFIDIGVPGFFDGLAATLLEAQKFLEDR